LELFGSCCRRLSQHGLGEVLILRRHCWPDAFFCVCVGSGSFCHDWGRTAQFCFRLLMRCLFVDSPSSLRPSRLLTHAKGHFVPWQGLGNRSGLNSRAFGMMPDLGGHLLGDPSNSIFVSRVPVGQKNLKRLVSAIETETSKISKPRFIV
jgi:hypothetical protein